MMNASPHCGAAGSPPTGRTISSVCPWRRRRRHQRRQHRLRRPPPPPVARAHCPGSRQRDQLVKHGPCGQGEWCSAVQCSAVRCGAVRCGAVRCSAVRRIAFHSLFCECRAEEEEDKNRALEGRGVGVEGGGRRCEGVVRGRCPRTSIETREGGAGCIVSVDVKT